MTVVKAELTRGEEILDIFNTNPIDPYAELSINDLSFSTTVAVAADWFPKWTESFEIDVKSLDDNLYLKVMNDNGDIESTFIGDATIQISDLSIDGLDKWFELSYQGASAGRVHLKSAWNSTESKFVS